MLSRLFPKHIDNVYRGHWFAIWLLAPLALVKMILGANTFFNTRTVIESADGIPLQSYSEGAQQILIFMYQSWGLGLFLMAALALLALIRYRAMTPLMYLLLTLENVGRTARQADNLIQIATSSGTPSAGAIINLTFIATLVFGLALSLWRTDRTARA